MPFAFRNDASLPGAQHTREVSGRVRSHYYGARKDIDEFISIRMLLAPVGWVALEVRERDQQTFDAVLAGQIADRRHA